MIFIRRHGKGERSAKAHLAHRMYCIHKGLRSATVEDGSRATANRQPRLLPPLGFFSVLPKAGCAGRIATSAFGMRLGGQARRVNVLAG